MFQYATCHGLRDIQQLSFIFRMTLVILRFLFVVYFFGSQFSQLSILSCLMLKINALEVYIK